MLSASDRPAEPVVVGHEPVAAGEVLAVARRGAAVRLSDGARGRIVATREHVERLAAAPTPVYGISTGFGALAVRHIAPAARQQMQRSLIRSHAAGMGEPVDSEVVRALMFLRLRTLASGRTGVRIEVADALTGLLNAGITPVVPSFGSLGCSGDLAPLAHCALVLMGEGEAMGPDGAVRPGAQLVGEAGIAPLTLHEKEGLALINGTDGMLGMLIMACADLGDLLTVADVTCAMSVEALLGTDQVFRPELHAPLRPHPGQTDSAANVFALLSGSAVVASHRRDDPRVQDAYSLRCAPQVAGAARDTLGHARLVATRELRAVIDNPVVLEDGTVASTGNFHGAPLSHVLDFLAVSAADVASIAERRTDRLLDPARNGGLKPFLADDPGVDSGLMIAQYTQASLVSEMKRLAVPASVDSIPSSAMQEDHVSMGWNAGMKLRRTLVCLRRVLAVELLTAARGLTLRAAVTGLAPAPATAAVAVAVAARAGGPGPDRFLSPELGAAEDMVATGEVIRAAEAVAGPLR